MLYDVVMFIFVFFYFFRALFHILLFSFFFFNDTATPEIYTYRHTLSLHDALPISPRGRKRVLTPSPVAQAADELGLRVVKADRLDADLTRTVVDLAPDLGVIVAYGGLVREPLLSTPVHGWINLHFSLLPRWRGAAPVQRALLAGERTLGASVFQLVPELDAGPVFAAEAHAVGEERLEEHTS